MLGLVISWVLGIYSIILLARLVLSWVPMFSPQWSPKGPVLVVAEAVYTLTDPPLRFLRRFIPPLRIGQVALDLSFIVLWLCVLLLTRLNAALLLS
ncbi:YggT family protein [Auraticoccus sp. F435]|uniref:YggT family protein n=1 Tax=Auraticoccus cholistanensis TaxID=2656650 RepID=A0A6A9UX25_9ACTN|nr:YggT family protein [Auraticoccus cholistanensis]MVA77288.1 YggT family protein [Auraticoccus cholistanensis]